MSDLQSSTIYSHPDLDGLVFIWNHSHTVNVHNIEYETGTYRRDDRQIIYDRPLDAWELHPIDNETRGSRRPTEDEVRESIDARVQEILNYEREED